MMVGTAKRGCRTGSEHGGEDFGRRGEGFAVVGVVIGIAKRDSESPSLVLVINDTKLLMSCVKCFELGISNTCDEDVCGKEWWPQDHKKMVHGHEMTIMVEMHMN
jgi:hypothetical protein